MVINPINTHPITIMHSNDPEILVCKCGNEPSVGDEFYYKSIYSKNLLLELLQELIEHISIQLMVHHIIKKKLKLNQNILQEKRNLIN